MDMISIQDIIISIGPYVGTFVICFISGLVPIVNAEIFLLFVASFIERPLFLHVLLLGTLGQMTAKVVLYYSGRGVLNLSMKRYADRINETREKMLQWGKKIDGFIFISAFFGLPPFYLISIVSGLIRHHLLRFFIFGFAGRFLRFGLLMFFPQLFRELFG